MPVRGRITAACLDAAVVVGFVALGRDSHAEGEAVGGIVTVAAPFLVGTAVGWLVVRHTRRPAGLRTGAIVWACTTVIGLSLRSLVFGRPTPVQFMLVAATFLAMMLLGWRIIWALIVRLRERGRTPPASEPSTP